MKILFWSVILWQILMRLPNCRSLLAKCQWREPKMKYVYQPQSVGLLHSLIEWRLHKSVSRCSYEAWSSDITRSSSHIFLIFERSDFDLLPGIKELTFRYVKKRNFYLQIQILPFFKNFEILPISLCKNFLLVKCSKNLYSRLLGVVSKLIR